MRLTSDEGVIPKNFGDTSRNKYFVVVGKTKDGNILGFVLINSNINRNLSVKLQHLHYPIKKDDYGFLEHDSFIYCGELKEMTTDKFSSLYEGDRCGMIHADDMYHVIESLKESTIETPKHLKKFGLL